MISCSSKSGLCLCSFDQKQYMAGIIKRVNIKEKIVPPTITTPIPILLVDAEPILMAIGNAPRAMVRLVIKIGRKRARSEEHTSELQSLMRISYAVFCLKKKKKTKTVTKII